MDVITYVKKYASEIDGQFTDYDHKTAVIIMPLQDGRYQTILATVRKGEGTERELAIFSSKVCQVDPGLNYQSLLERSATLDFSKFVVNDGFVKVEGTCIADRVREDQVRDMLAEIASVADEYELMLTGQDIH